MQGLNSKKEAVLVDAIEKSNEQRYQLMPEMSKKAFESLKADIKKNGLRVPIDVDEDGNILDGYHRWRACRELNMDCETRTVSCPNEEEKIRYSLMTNIARRQLTAAQRKETAKTIRRSLGSSDAEIAKMLAVDNATVWRWFNNAKKPTVTVSELRQEIADHKDRADRLKARLEDSREMHQKGLNLIASFLATLESKSERGFDEALISKAIEYLASCDLQ
jgi:ParB-like chromosome segregation protein Spo0J